jgi:molybdopterin-guanine dinucleotide biosynthesis protein A
MKAHNKHAKLKRSRNGLFGPLNIALLGAPCSVIQSIAAQIMESLPSLKSAYIDAEHATVAGEADSPHAASNITYITKSGGNHKIQLDGALDLMQRSALLNDRDLVLFNGNHFDAENQILILDDRKPLHRKADKISNPIMVLYQSSDYQPLNIPDKAGLLSNLPVHHNTATDDISSTILETLHANTPEVYGLVLAGGLSTRMGTDKGALQYHQKPQREHMFDLLEALTSVVFLSCRADQADAFGTSFAVLPDTFTGLGPYGALLSAFREYPDKAWLVAACDLPMVGVGELSQLLHQRDPHCVATAFRNEQSGLPEPLITIWEPRAYPILLQFLSRGVSCPRKVLINSQVHLIEPENPGALANINSPAEYEAARQALRKQQN